MIDSKGKTLEELQTIVETMVHIEKVRNLIALCIDELEKGQLVHDRTKLEEPELSLFTEYTPKLSNMTYGSDEYNKCLEEIAPALDHHYKINQHHPEHTRRVEEIWAGVFGYEGLYAISTFGEVKRLARRGKIGKGYGDIKEKIITPSLTPKGYQRIQLSKDGCKKNHFIHRLVADAFVESDDYNSNAQINHINGVKQDNFYKNLEWTTPSENQRHAYANNLKIPKVKYIVHCEELDVVTFGIDKMVALLKKMGHDNIRAGSIHHCLNDDKTQTTHGGLTFSSYNLEDVAPSSDMKYMTLVDLVEMICDWKASSLRHRDGNILQSIDINVKRFGIDNQLAEIMRNTVQLFEGKNVE